MVEIWGDGWEEVKKQFSAFIKISELKGTSIRLSQPLLQILTLYLMLDLFSITPNKELEENQQFLIANSTCYVLFLNKLKETFFLTPHTH